jgi:hypothetical protein
MLLYLQLISLFGSIIPLPVGITLIFLPSAYDNIVQNATELSELCTHAYNISIQTAYI